MCLCIIVDVDVRCEMSLVAWSLGVVVFVTFDSWASDTEKPFLLGQGGFSALVRSLRMQCIELLTEIEARLDFDDEMPPLDLHLIMDKIHTMSQDVENALETANYDKLLQSGLQVWVWSERQLCLVRSAYLLWSTISPLYGVMLIHFYHFWPSYYWCHYATLADSNHWPSQCWQVEPS